MSSLAHLRRSKRLKVHNHANHHTTVHATGKSAFFTMLPLELRRAILNTAFGNWTFHIQGVYAKDARVEAASPYDQVRTGWAGRACRRPLDQASDPAQDHCLKSRKLGRRVGHHDRSTASLGLLGWLLACRQAHAEAIEVLCGSNTFSIFLSSWFVAGGLVNQLPGAYFPFVQTLELLLPCAHTRDELHQLDVCLLSSISTSMPSLTSLYIGFLTGNRFSFEKPGEMWWVLPKYRYLGYTRRVFPDMDKIFRGFGGRRIEFEVAVPWSVFFPHFTDGLADRLKFQAPDWKPETGLPQGGYFPRRRIWRPVEAHDGGPPNNTKGGYWVGETLEDKPFGWGETTTRFWNEKWPDEVCESV